MSNEYNCFIMGYPGSGKTTFLAALWYSIFNAEQSTDIPLKLNKLGDSSYFAQLSKRWANAQPLSRTTLENEKKELHMDLAFKEDVKTIILNCPDLSGETFTNIYVNRQIEMSLKDCIAKADSFLLFVNVNNVKDASLISNINLNIDDESIHPIQNRDPMLHDPTCVMLVDLLQIVQELHSNRPIRLEIIFSAWDEVSNMNTPIEYMKNELNMLWQFIEANKHIFKVNAWGVSAQGGDLVKDHNSLIDINPPTNRIKVVDEQGLESHDITLPILRAYGERNE